MSFGDDNAMSSDDLPTLEKFREQLREQATGDDPYDFADEVPVKVGVTVSLGGMSAEEQGMAWSAELRDGETAADLAKEFRRVGVEAIRKHCQLGRPEEVAPVPRMKRTSTRWAMALALVTIAAHAALYVVGG
jgi:hypothetical protein